MKILVATKETYVPEWNGNRDLPDEEQIKVDIVFPTAGERDEINSISVRENAWMKSWVSRFAKKIYNLSEEADGVERKIETGEDLVKSVSRDLYSLANEVCLAILGRSELKEKKS
jgi:hypothetical protein